MDEIHLDTCNANSAEQKQIQRGRGRPTRLLFGQRKASDQKEGGGVQEPAQNSDQMDAKLDLWEISGSLRKLALGAYASSLRKQRFYLKALCF